MTEQERLAAGLRYLEQQKKADPLESFRSLEGLKGAYERRVQPIINNAMQTFETGGAIGDLLRAYGSAAAPANAAVLEGMGMPYRGPITAPRQEGVSSGENFRAMGDPRQQAVGQMIGDPANLAQPVGARLANALKFAKPDAMKMVQEMSRGAISPMDVWHGSPHRFASTSKNPLGEFDASKIGTGEGAQAYGYGHYVAEQPLVAKDYKFMERNWFDTDVATYQGKPIQYWYDKAQRDQNIAHRTKNPTLEKDANARLAYWESVMMHEHPESVLKKMTDQEFGWPEATNYAKSVNLDKFQGIAEPGALYKVDLPDEVVPRMLDWDKPLSPMGNLQIKPVAKNYNGTFGTGEYGGYAWHLGDAQLSRAFRTPEKAQQYAPLGSEIIKELNAITATPTGHAELLSKAGIPGIKYLDQFSREKGKGTRNFVVFPGNEGLLNILGRE